MVGKWALGFVAAGGALWWLQKYLQQQQANAESDARSQNQTDAQLAYDMLSNPLASASYTAQPVSSSGPTVDTGNETLQQLINSVLNPTTGTTTATSTPSNAQPTTYSGVAAGKYFNPAPVQSGGTLQSQLLANGTGTFSTQPGILHMPVATNMVQ